MEKRKKKIKKNEVIIIIITFVLAWLLGILRFENSFLTVIFQIVVLPFGSLFIWFEKLEASITTSNHFINNEYFGGLVFFIFVSLQSFLYVKIYQFIRKIRKNGKK